MAVTYLDHMGRDVTVVDAARVSFARQADDDIDWSRLQEEDPDLYFWLARQDDDIRKSIPRKLGYSQVSANDAKLLGFLARNRHGSPFEHIVLQLHVECPIVVSREWLRHRIASYNEVSTRYVEFGTDFHMPAARVQKGKPGAYSIELVPDHPNAAKAQELIQAAYDFSYQAYQEVMELGFARDMARFPLPLGLMTQFITTINFRSLTNFLSLRNHPAATYELQQDAAAVEEIVRETWPVCYQVWVDGGRQPL